MKEPTKQQLVETIKKLKDKIETLETEISQYEGESHVVEELEEQIYQLEWKNVELMKIIEKRYDALTLNEIERGP